MRFKIIKQHSNQQIITRKKIMEEIPKESTQEEVDIILKQKNIQSNKIKKFNIK